jgi:hypothetical protein
VGEGSAENMSRSNFIIGIHVEAYAMLHFGRMVWRDLKFRERLLNHGSDARHPHTAPFTSKGDPATKDRGQESDLKCKS